jgi:metal-sulfur cluster biosynthetic enzyme
MVTTDDVQEALANVIDPELGLDFVELGLIYEIEIEGGDVHVTFTLTAPAARSVRRSPRRSRSSCRSSTASSRCARRWSSRRHGRPTA